MIRKKKKTLTAKENNARTRIKRPIPLTSEDQLKRTRTQVNATNRNRARSMEQRIAKYLRGDRTPASGAMAKYKGDITVDFVNNPGKYIIECKMSAGKDGNDNKQIGIQFSWFPKIKQEAAAMRAKFGILVIHYHNAKGDYVFVDDLTLTWLMAYSPFSSALSRIKHVPFVIDMRFKKNNEPRAVYSLKLQHIEDTFTDIEGIKVVKALVPEGMYYIFTLQQYRDLLEGI